MLCAVLLNFWSAVGNAQDRDTRVILPAENSNELIVLGAGRCGSWPIGHRELENCEFAELEKDDLPKVLELRRTFFSVCLSCNGNQCALEAWPRDRISEQLFCKRVYWTPTHVPRFISTDKETGPLRVTYIFTISVDGSVKDIEIGSFEGDVEEQEMLDLIVSGASKTRFEPLTLDDVAYELVGLQESIIRQ